MDKLVPADVDAHMGGPLAAVAIVEEHQVAGLELALGDGGSVVHLGGGRAVDRIAEVLTHIGHKAGAVKAAGAGAAVDIGIAHILLGKLGDLTALAGGRGRRGIHLRHIVAADIAAVDLVPAAGAADQLLDLHDGPHGQGVHLLRISAGAGADVQGPGHDLAVDFFLGDLQIIAGHEAGGPVIGDFMPLAVSGGAQYIHLGPAGQGGEDLGLGAGLRPDIQSGVAHNGAHRGCKGRGDHSGDRQDTGGQFRGQGFGQVHGRVPPFSLYTVSFVQG